MAAQHPRRETWEALSTLFLDTDTSLLRAYRSTKLAESPHSLEELDRILRDEVAPVCLRHQISTIAGEWAGFDPDWLETSILSHLQSRKILYRISLSRWLVTRSREWRKTKEQIRAFRSERHTP